MQRRDFLRTLGVAAVSLTMQGCKTAAAKINNVTNIPDKKPNFVFILVDDLGWADTACYGSKYYETPNIDRLAEQGMKFSDGYAACCVCSPTRASVLTGRYPTRTGVTDWIHYHEFKGDKNDPGQKQRDGYKGKESHRLLCPAHHLWLDLDEVTIAEMLKPAGYATCHIGKWHLGHNAWYPDKQGFDHNIGGCERGQPPRYFDPYKIKTLENRKKGEYLTDRESDEAVKFIKENRNQPFFLYMSHYAVHTPIQAKKELTEKYKAKKATKQNNAKYAAMIDSVDQAVGKIIAVLDELKLAEDTVIFFTSDNGGLGVVTDNSPLREGKGFPYEGGIREPVIVRWPGRIKAGSQCAVPVTSVDYFPTICEMAEVKLPSDRAIDGESILPLLKQTGSLSRDAIFWHYPHYRENSKVPYKIPPNSIIRKGDWKLIKFYEPYNGNEFELFNLKNDISEKNELSSKRPDKVKELDSELTVWLKETGAKFPKANPNYVGEAETKKKK